MKKFIFYITNSIICSVFLAIRFAFSLFVADREYLTDSTSGWLTIFTFILVIGLLVNIYFAYLESKQ